MSRIKRVEFHVDFRSLDFEAQLAGERNDCAVKAISIVCEVPYKLVHERLEALGRKNHRGTQRYDTMQVIKSFGFQIREWTKLEQMNMVWSYPHPHHKLKGITSHHPRRFPQAWKKAHTNLLLFSNRHVSAYKDGQLIDWAVNKALRINSVWEIRRN